MFSKINKDLKKAGEFLENKMQLKLIEELIDNKQQFITYIKASMRAIKGLHPVEAPKERFIEEFEYNSLDLISALYRSVELLEEIKERVAK